MDLTNQTQIPIQNKVFTLGSPVVNAESLDQLLYIFQQQGIQDRPIVIINPVSDSIPDFSRLLENYIENGMKGMYSQQHTTYMFQDASDEDIRQWAEIQYSNGGNQSLDYLIATGMAIREQSQLKRDLDQAKARRDELWRRHCANPNSEEGSDEYANLSYNVIPQIESAIQQVTDKLRNIPKNLDNGSVPRSVQTNVENLVESVENHVDIVKTNVENPVESVDKDLEMTGTGKPALSLTKPSRLIMPISVAKQIAQSPQNQVYQAQQQQEVPGYTTVPIEYLIALGIQLYADGVPIVYTKSGNFRRIGNSNVSPIVSSYWYPTPRYK